MKPTVILICIGVVYLLGFGAEPISTIDDQVMLTSAMNLLKTGKLVVPERFARPSSGGASFGRTAASGDVYIKYPPGYPLLLAAFLFPARLAGRQWGGTAADLVLCVPSMLGLLGTALLLWLACKRLGLARSAANIATVGFALGSYAWAYAGVNFSEPLQMLCVFAAFYCLLASMQEESRWQSHVITGGVALGFGVLTKSSLGLLMPVMGLGALWGWTRRDTLRAASARAGLFALPSVAAGVYLAAVNAFRFGNAADFGYKGEAFTGSVLQGLRDLTVGWDKGLIWFAPLVVLAPLGLWRLGRRSWVGPTLFACSAAYLLLIARWYGYRGGNCWGPRLLMPVLPLLLLMAAAALDSWPWRRLAVALVGVGIAVNALGVLVNYQSYYIALASSPVKPDWRDPAYAQIRGHLWLARVQMQMQSLTAPQESTAAWSSPPWISRSAAAAPAHYRRYDEPVVAPWPLRLALAKPWLRRADLWYLRSLLEVAIMRYEAADLARAMELLREGLEVEPGYAPMVAAQAMIYYTARDFPRALTQFERSVALDAGYELGWYGRGLAFEALGNPREAALSYHRLLQLPAKDVSRTEVQQRLSRLGADE